MPLELELHVFHQRKYKQLSPFSNKPSGLSFKVAYLYPVGKSLSDSLNLCKDSSICPGKGIPVYENLNGS